MRKAIRYTCAYCGEEHDGAPSVAFDSPHYYSVIPEDERDESTWLSRDFFVVEGRDRFIRCTLEVPIVGSAEGFLWGVWLSLSETKFEDYREHFNDDRHRARYVGWISNVLPGYPDTLEVVGAATLHPDGQRPTIEPELSDHALCADYRDGISWDRAIELVQLIRHAFDA